MVSDDYNAERDYKTREILKEMAEDRKGPVKLGQVRRDFIKGIEGVLAVN